MSLQSVRQFLAQHTPDVKIIELNQNIATVNLAAEAHNVEPGQIMKTLSLEVKNDIILVVAKGDARLGNKKLENTFDIRARMLSSDEIVSATRYPVSGVCPFGLETPISVYCDVPLKHYTGVLFIAGAIHSTVHITSERMAELAPAI